MRNDKHLALSLRRKGASYKKISKELGIPKSTMHYWFRDLRWSQSIKKKLSDKAARLSTKRMRSIAKSNKLRWEKWRKQHRVDARKEFPIIKNTPLFIAGLMLYWGEGDSNPKNAVRFCNTDYRMIRLFYIFLLNICKIDRNDIFVALTIYPDLSDEKCKSFWRNKIGIRSSQFVKSQVIYGKHPTKRLEYGICTVRVKRSVGLKEKIFIWTKMIFENLDKNKRA